MNDRPRFTLPELALIIFVLALLLALLMPMVQQQRENARREELRGNLKDLGFAAHAYNDRVRRLPPAHDGTRAVQEILAPDYKTNYDILTCSLDYSCPGRHRSSPPWTGIAANYYIFGTDNNEVKDITTKPGFAGLKDPVMLLPQFGYTPLAVNTIRDGTSNTIMWVTCLAQPAGQDVVTNGPASWPGQATGPFHACLEWEKVPAVANATCASGKHAQSYSSEGIVIGLADGGARVWTNSFAATAYPPSSLGSVLLPNDNVSGPWDY
jgi:type II secretory pathway pseudopilin PulG